jgi:hypothetical protein
MYQILDASAMQPTVCECEARQFTCSFPSQQNTSSWQPRQWHMHMMVSLTPNSSIFIQTSYADFSLPDLVAFYGDNGGDLITVPWDPGICIELSIEGLQSEFVEQHTSSEDHFGKHHGAQHQCIVYNSCARIVWRIAHHLSYWVLDVWVLSN